MDEIDYSPIGGASRPQEGRGGVVQASIDSLGSHEFNKLNRIIDEEYSKKQVTILDKPFGEVINNTINFFGNSFDMYSNKLVEAEFTQNLYKTDNSYLNTLQKHLLAFSLFIRDEEIIIYLGILMIILSVLICFFNISRTYEHSDTTTKS